MLSPKELVEQYPEKVEEFLKLSFEEKRAMGIAGHNKMTREFNREIVISKYMDEVKKA